MEQCARGMRSERIVKKRVVRRGSSRGLPMLQKKQKPTLRALAQELGVHVSTISRVLQGGDTVAAKAASPETIKRIRDLARDYGYTPNPHAISLKTSQSKWIGVIVPRLSDYVWASIYEGLEEYAIARNYFAYVTNGYDDPACRRRQVSMAEARRVDGMIIGDVHLTDETLDLLGELQIPFVTVLRYAGSSPSVAVDDYDGGRQAAKHLFEQGHRNVGVLAEQNYTPTGRDRARGFVEFFQEAGYPIAPERTAYSHVSVEEGRQCTQHLLESFPDLTALYGTNDFAAIGAIWALRDAGHTVGRTMALIGYNDTPLASELPIPLTTLRSPFRKIGALSMEMLLGMLAGKTPESVLLKPKLIVRESSGYAARPLP